LACIAAQPTTASGRGIAPVMAIEDVVKVEAKPQVAVLPDRKALYHRNVLVLISAVSRARKGAGVAERIGRGRSKCIDVEDAAIGITRVIIPAADDGGTRNPVNPICPDRCPHSGDGFVGRDHNRGPTVIILDYRDFPSPYHLTLG